MRRAAPEELFRQAIDRHGMIRAGDSVLAAVSGGGDSVLMLHLLARLRREIPFHLEIAHLDHRLRGAESDADAAFVAELAGRLSLHLTAGEADLTRAAGDPSSVEERAREARRSFLLATARERGLGRVALGHTLDDQAETILMWLLRGTGRRGLAGMEAAAQGGIIRPLILVRRSEVRAHLRRMSEPFREDSSNEDVSRTRNRIRRELLPVLDERFPGGAERLAGAAEGIAAEEEVLDAMARDLLLDEEGRVSLPPASGPEVEKALAPRAIRIAAGLQGMDPRLLERRHIGDILSRADEGGTFSLDLPGPFRAEIRAGSLRIARRERSSPRKR